MKYTTFFYSLFLFCSLVFSSCKKDSNNNINNSEKDTIITFYFKGKFKDSIKVPNVRLLTYKPVLSYFRLDNPLIENTIIENSIFGDSVVDWFVCKLCNI